MRRTIEQVDAEIQQLESRVEQVQNDLQQIDQQLLRLSEAIARLASQGDKEASEALHGNLREKQKKEQDARQEISRLTADLDNLQSRLADAQMQNDQSRAEIEALGQIGEDVGGAQGEVSERDAVLRFQEQQVRILRETLGSCFVADTAFYEPRFAPPISERTRWIDEGIQLVAVSEFAVPEGIQSAMDFHKVSETDMKAGILRLQEMRPAIENGAGANSDYWAAFDRVQGLEYRNGYQQVYDAFFGMDAIKVSFDGKKYDIINGRHRIWLAQKMGIDFLPMRITRKVENHDT